MGISISNKETSEEEILPTVKKKYYVIMESTHCEDTVILTVYVSKNRASKSTEIYGVMSATLIPPGSLLEMQSLRPHPSPTDCNLHL